MKLENVNNLVIVKECLIDYVGALFIIGNIDWLLDDENVVVISGNCFVIQCPEVRNVVLICNILAVSIDNFGDHNEVGRCVTLNSYRAGIGIGGENQGVAFGCEGSCEQKSHRQQRQKQGEDLTIECFHAYSSFLYFL